MRLTEAEVAALKQAEQETKRPGELRWMQAVRLFGSGMAVEQVMEVTGLSERTIQRQAARFREEGIAGLRERRVGGNRALLTDQQRAELAVKLHQYRPVDLKVSERIDVFLNWTYRRTSDIPPPSLHSSPISTLLMLSQLPTDTSGIVWSGFQNRTWLNNGAGEPDTFLSGNARYVV